MRARTLGALKGTADHLPSDSQSLPQPTDKHEETTAATTSEAGAVTDGRAALRCGGGSSTGHRAL